MDRNQFQSAADELLDQQVEAVRPKEDNYAQLRQEREGYSHGSMASQQSAANLTNNRINAPYVEHAAQQSQQRQEQRQDVGETREIAEQNHTNMPEQSQEKEPDWQRYAQDKEYRTQVDEREKGQQETQQQRQATVQHERER